MHLIETSIKADVDIMNHVNLVCYIDEILDVMRCAASFHGGVTKLIQE
jgi:acyl-ACP thioesterase